MKWWQLAIQDHACQQLDVTAIERTTAGINKAEDAGRIDPQIGFADALRRLLPTTMASLSPISGLDSPGDLVQPKFSNV